MEKLRTLEKNYRFFPSEVKEEASKILLSLGVPCFHGKEGVEAEKIASLLSLHDISIATFSSDGDCLAHGAPFLIQSTVGKNFVVAERQTILDLLELTEEQFVDVCICSGCDYNKNLKGRRFPKNLELIKKHGSVRELPSDIDTSELKYEECLEEFSDCDICQLLEEDCLEYYGIESWNSLSTLSIEKKEIEIATLADFDLSRYISQIEEILKTVPEPKNYVHFEICQVEINGEIYTSKRINEIEDCQSYSKRK